MAFIPLFAVPSGLELAVILLIAVLLFGANKIPKLARSTGQAMGEFQRGREEIEQELEEMKESAEVDTDVDTEVDTSVESSEPDTSQIDAEVDKSNDEQ
ncbi:MAG: twin-arginine translocase TatA/TatE family subunit [Halobacteriaceae archaeon]